MFEQFFRENRCICLCFGIDFGKSDFSNVLMNLSVINFRRFSVKMRFLNSFRENSCICLCFGVDFGKSTFRLCFCWICRWTSLSIFKQTVLFEQFFAKIAAYAHVLGLILEKWIFEYFVEFVDEHCWMIFSPNVFFKQCFVQICAYAYVWGSILEKLIFRILLNLSVGIFRRFSVESCMLHSFSRI